MGLERFRKVIAEYVRAVRGVNCDERQILVVSGSQQALELSAHVLLDAGDSVWFEEPGYWLARRAFALAGCQIVPVPVDNEGLEINAGIRQCREARLAYVTPSHQFPLGTTMSVARRMQLLDWAQSSGSWIIEDDYDSEYRYEGTLIPSLQGLDANSRVIYVGTFSKILFPSLRVGYLVVPPDLVDRFVATRIAMDMYPPQLYQAVLADFIGDGHLARHTRRMRLIYGEKREILVDALESEFGSSLEILGEEAGMHLVAAIPPTLNDREIAMNAARQNLWLWPLSPMYQGKSPRQGFILGFGSAPANEILPAVRRLPAFLRAVA